MQIKIMELTLENLKIKRLKDGTSTDKNSKAQGLHDR